MKSIRDIYKIGKGPSSSHTIGPERAAKHFKETHPDADAYQVDLFGSLSKTGKGHGTDRVLREVLSPLPTTIVFRKDEPEFVRHPNTMVFSALKNGAVCDTLKVESIGGGDHQWEVQAENPATCYGPASTIRYCPICETEIETEHGSIGDHYYVNGRCDYCGEPELKEITPSGPIN